MFDSHPAYFRKQVFNTEHLHRKDAIERSHAEFAFVMDEVGEMGRTQTCLFCEERAGELSPLDTAADLHAKPFVELRKIHLWNCVFELYTSVNQFADCKALLQCLSVFRV